MKFELQADADGDRFAVFLRWRKTPFLDGIHRALVQVLVKPLYDMGVLGETFRADDKTNDHGADGSHAATIWILRSGLFNNAWRSDPRPYVVDLLVVSRRLRTT